MKSWASTAFRRGMPEGGSNNDAVILASMLASDRRVLAGAGSEVKDRKGRWCLF